LTDPEFGVEAAQVDSAWVNLAGFEGPSDLVMSSISKEFMK